MTDLVVIADNIRSVYNIGSLLRIAAFFGVGELALCGVSTYPGDPKRRYVRPGRRLEKVALGAEKMQSWRYFSETGEALEYYRERGYRLVALEQAAEAQSLHQYRPSGKVALLVGEELHGLAPELIEKCAEVIEIPGEGEKGSLNVATATAVAVSWVMRVEG